MRRELSAITDEFEGREWRAALGARLRESELAMQAAGHSLHDEVGQILSVVGLELGVLELDARARAPELVTRVDAIQAQLDSAMAQVREISRKLNPSPAARTGLRFALERLAEHERSVRITVEYAADVAVPAPSAIALFAVTREAIRHACASQVLGIHVKVLREDRVWLVELLYKVLYDVTSPQSSIELKAYERSSLLLLEYQAMRAGVSVVLSDTPDGATRIRVIVPTE